MAPLNILVTGASGFLGRHLVRELAARGHRVRGVMRAPASFDSTHHVGGEIEYVQADLLNAQDLVGVCERMNVVIHLAAQMHGNGAEQVRQTVVATKNLMEAAADSSVSHIVLASSMSVYDWSTGSGLLDENTPLEPKPKSRDAYAQAKLQQEQLVANAVQKCGWTLATLRPGYIWGRGASYSPGIAAKLGPVKIVISPCSRLPLVYVENCAMAFADAAEAQLNLTANLIDDETISTWRFVQAAPDAGHRGIRLGVPYVVGLAAACVAGALTAPFGLTNKLPGLLQPRRFRARFRPLEFGTARTRSTFSWRPRFGFAEALERSRSPQTQVAVKHEVAV